MLAGLRVSGWLCYIGLLNFEFFVGYCEVLYCEKSIPECGPGLSSCNSYPAGFFDLNGDSPVCP
jgi:hypothetical protein